MFGGRTSRRTRRMNENQPMADAEFGTGIFALNFGSEQCTTDAWLCDGWRPENHAAIISWTGGEEEETSFLLFEMIARYAKTTSNNDGEDVLDSKARPPSKLANSAPNITNTQSARRIDPCRWVECVYVAINAFSTAALPKSSINNCAIWMRRHRVKGENLKNSFTNITAYLITVYNLLLCNSGLLCSP